MEAMERMKELVLNLSAASRAYYQEDREVMSNLEYDQLYDELLTLEEKTGTILSGSPTQKVGYEILSALPKEKHDQPMLSLDKTKDREALVGWLGNQEGLLSWKLDGLTVVLTYENGKLIKGVTRGNGTIGEVITNNVKVFKNVPLSLKNEGNVIVRGEAVIHYDDFEQINALLPLEEQYKNPRNLCSGSVRQLNNEITAKRHVRLYAFSLVNSDAQLSSKKEQLDWLSAQGFDVVNHHLVTSDTILETIEAMSGQIESLPMATDGLVLTYNDIAYGQSLGRTSKFPKDSIAFKWQDELKETRLKDIEWNASRTGLINPIAIFDPVDLEGTTVTRASLHNISILRGLKLGIGDTIKVYKANMIIPQISENMTQSDTYKIPEHCPVCHEAAVVKTVNDVSALYCENPLCAAKSVKRFAHYVSRDALNVENLSEATLEKFIDAGYLKELDDLYHLDQYRESIVQMEGFGEKSYERLMKGIEKARQVPMENFIYALGILNVGLSNAKLLVSNYKGDFEAIRSASPDELVEIEGYGQVIAGALVDYFTDEDKKRELDHLLEEITFDDYIAPTGGLALDGLTFVITGSVELYDNRKALQAEIERLGGKVTGSVTKNTNYLINNDVTSTSGKNKKAQDLGIPIISEVDYQQLISG